MSGPSKTGLRALVAIAVACVLLGAPRRAHAAEEGALGFLVAFALAAGVGVGAVPLLVFREADAKVELGFGVGVGGEGDAAALSVSAGGDLDREGRFGWTARGRADLAVDDNEAHLEGSMRFDALGSAVVVGDPGGPMTLSALAGAVAWLSTEDRDGSGYVEAYGAGGPAVGARIDVRSDYVRGRVEATYVPLFGEAPSRVLHHLDVTSTIAVTPWPESDDIVAFEAMLKREIGFGGDELYGGTVVTLGMSFRLDPTRAPPPPSPGFPPP